MTIRTVAVIGVGAMGNPMARRIHDAGFALTVCDTSEKALAPFATLGVRTTRQAAECAGCDAVIILVATPDQARQVALGADGLRAGLSGKPPMLVVMGTVAPATMHELQSELEPLGIRVVDAPVSGGLVKARDGTLAIMMGGRSEDIDALQPLMASMGKSVFRCGALGAGQATKIVNNAMGIASIMIAAEAYRIGLDNGLRLEDAVPVFEASSGRNFFSRNPRDASDAYAAWAPTRADFNSLQAIMRKDIDLALAIGSDAASLPVMRALRTMLDGVGEETFETWRTVARAGMP
ncbi:MAG TPA: NAD(P)-dependent oxidoreductase [Vineibacter sp.]|nr:NAD(P)-dependent oxidoreductase [Vineibacter sp.]